MAAAQHGGLTRPAQAARDAHDARLVGDLAPRLGLRPGSVRIVTVAGGREAAASPGPAQVRLGAAAPPSASLLAHELAHVVQHRNRLRPEARPDVTAAEAEAGALAAAAATGARLWVPRAALPAGRVARLKDASGVSPSAPPAHHTLEQLDDLVRRSRAAEIRQIADAFAATFTSHASAVETGLQTLDGVDFATARAIARTLGNDPLAKLARLGDDDHRRHPDAAATVLSALPALDDDHLRDLATGTFDRPLQDALHGITVSRLSPDVLRALQDALRQLFVRGNDRAHPLIDGQDILVKLARGDRRDEIHALVQTPPPMGSEQPLIDAAYARESRLAPEKAGGAPTADAARINDTAAKLQKAFDQPQGANAAESALAAVAPGDLDGAVVAELDRHGLVEKILDTLPAPKRYASPSAPVLAALLAARSPSLTLPRIERLLSYGPLNWWWVSDADARFAYLLLRSLPVAVQDAWRMREGGKWYERLEHNYPFGDRDAAEAYTGVGSELRPAGAAQANDNDVQNLVLQLQAIWRDRDDGSGTARYIARLLTGRDPDSGAPPTERRPDGRLPAAPVAAEVVRTVAARKLDAGGLLVQLYDAFSDDYLMSEDGRQEVLDLTSLRDPLNVERQATDLLSTGILHWWVSSRSAWIAYQLLRALPTAFQRQWNEDHPGMWSRMTSAMTSAMRGSLATSAATGRGEFPGRDALRARLRDPALWADGRQRELRALIVLARASDDAEFVFWQSRDRQAWTHPWLKPLVDWYALYDPDAQPPRRVFGHEQIEPLSGFVELLRWVDSEIPVRWALVGIGAWLFMDWVSLGGYSVKLHDFDLGWAQWAMGGDLGVAKLSEDARSGPGGEPPASATLTPGAAKPLPNRLSMEADLGTGAIRLRLPELRLERVNLVRAGASYRTGPLVLKGLRVQGDFSDRGYKEPVGVQLEADLLDVDDMALADPSLPGGAIAAGHLQTHPLHLKSGVTGKEDLEAHKPREGSIPIPIIGPLMEALANIVAIKGGIPGSPTLVDLALLGPTWNMNFLASEAITKTADWLVPSPAPLDYPWGLFSDGVLRPPRSVTQRLQDAGQMLRALEVSFDELKIDGLSIGAGTQVSSVVFKDVAIGYGTAGPLGYLRMMLSSLQQALARAVAAKAPEADQQAIRARIAEIQAKLKSEADKRPGFDAAQARMQELEARDRWNPGSLSPDEVTELATLSDRVGRDTSLMVRIGSIEVGRVSGKIESGGAVVKDIRLDGTVPLKRGGYYADETLAARFVAGGVGSPTVGALAHEADVRLTIGEARLVPLPDGTALRIAADHVPTSEELLTRLAAMPADADPSLRKPIVDALGIVDQIEKVRAAAGGRDPSPADQHRIRALTDQVRALLGVSVGSVDLGRIEGGVDPGSGQLSLHATGVDIGRIRGDGFAVQRVQGSVSLGVAGLDKLTADVRGATDTAALAQAKQTLGVHFGLDVTAEGIVTERGGAQKLTIAGLAGDVRMEDGKIVLTGVGATSISLDGVELGVADGHLSAVRATVEGLALEATIGTRETDGRTSLDSVVVPRLHIDRISADTIDYRGLGADGGTLEVHVDSGALGQIDVTGLTVALPERGPAAFGGAATIGGIDDLRYRVVVGVLAEPGKPAGETLSVAGTLAGGSMTPGPAVKPVVGVGFASGPDGHRYSLDLAALQVLGTTFRTPDGHLTVARTTVSGSLVDSDRPGDKERGSSADLTLSGVQLRDVGFAAGTAYITNQGGAGVRGGTIRAGSIHVVARRELDAQGKPARIGVSLLELLDVEADRLTYSDGPRQFHLGTDPEGGAAGALHVKRIALSGLVLPYRKDGTLGGVQAGHVAVTGAHVQFGGSVAGAVESMTGTIDVDSLTVDLDRSGQKVKVDGLSGDIGVTAGPATVHTKLEGIGASVSIAKDAITVDGLRLEKATIDQLTVAGGGYSVLTYGGGAVTVNKLEARARIELGEKGGIQRVVVERFEIASVEAAGVMAAIGGDVSITLPPLAGAPNAVLTHIQVTSPDSTRGLEISPADLGAVAGLVTLDSAAIRRLEVGVAGTFHGPVAVQAGAVKLGTVQRGRYTIDVTRPRAQLLDPAQLDTYDRTIRVSELGAASVHADLEPGPGAKTRVAGLDVDHPFVGGLAFRQPGVQVDVGRIEVPDLVKLDDKKGRVSRLSLSDARISLDLTKLSSGGGGGGAPPIDQATIERLVESVQGDVSVRVLLPDYYVDDRVSIHVTDGRIDYEALLDAILSGASGQPVGFWIWRSRLYLGDKDPIEALQICHWDLEPAELKEAQDAHTIRLTRLPDVVMDHKSSSSSSSPTILNLYDVNIRAWTWSAGPIPVRFDTPSVTGTVSLSRSAVKTLNVSGSLSPLGTGSGAFDLTLDGLDVDAAHLKLVASGATIDTGHITIGAMDRGILLFRGKTPTELSAHITSAVAENISWALK